MSKHMKAVRSIVGQPLELISLERPSPGPGQVLIRVKAAGVNRPDLIQRAGRYPPPPGAPDTLGLEASGWVEAVGAGVTSWSVGEAVTALLPGGGYAEYALAPEGSVLPAPPSLSLPEAAGLPPPLAAPSTHQPPPSLLASPHHRQSAKSCATSRRSW